MLQNLLYLFSNFLQLLGFSRIALDHMCVCLLLQSFGTALDRMRVCLLLRSSGTAFDLTKYALESLQALAFITTLTIFLLTVPRKLIGDESTISLDFKNIYCDSNAKKIG